MLLQRSNTGYRDGDYDVPAGHLEENETLVAATIREAKEEASVVINPEDLRFHHVMHRKTPGRDGRVYLDFYFVADKWQGKPKIGEPDKCSHMDWFTLDQLPSNMIPYQKEAIEMVNNPFSEWGWKADA